MFLFKEDSRNAFNNDREEENFKVNYQNLFHMRLPHMDTVDNVMRQLKESELEKLKASMIRDLLNKKSLHKFRLLGNFFIIAVDGTGIHTFSERHCDQCLTQESKNGKITYFHNVLEAKLICSNGFSISLATEWIENPVGDFDKQDCGRKAFKRLAEKIKKSFPRLPLCITADGLYPSQPFFNICRENNWHFIVTFKEGNLPSVWEKIRSLPGSVLIDNRREIITHSGKKKVTDGFRWINGIDYNGYELNWLDCTEKTISIETGKIKTVRFVHLTDIAISRDNVAELSRTGRLRWKIENEGFNTQKNHGYNLQHKYSRSSYTASKNYYQCLQIAHLINQLVELSKDFRLLKGKKTVKHLWKCLIGFFTYGLIIVEDLSCILKKRSQVRFE